MFEKMLDKFENLKDIIPSQLLNLKEDVTEQHELLDAKKEVVTTFIEKLESSKKLGLFSLFFSEDMKESLTKFLLWESFFDKVVTGIKRELFESKLYDETTATYIKDFKSRLQDSKTKESLQSLTSQLSGEISSLSVPSEQVLANQQGESEPYLWEQPSSVQMEISNLNISGIDNSKYIEKILTAAEKYEGVAYKWWGISPSGFDCSGLRYYTFKQQGISFPSRFTAEVFNKKDTTISKDSAQPGDFMYWKSKPWQKKHNDIYHIEMLVEKPYLKNGKWYVKTFGSSTDKWIYVDGKQTNRSGVGFRVREINDYRHFGRPSYYEQLAQYDHTGDTSVLRA